MHEVSLIRQPAVAGFFYPANPADLSSVIGKMLEDAPITESQAPKALIAPHAGYIYSGPIAATIYKTLLPHKDRISRVILLGPAHRVGFRGMALTNFEKFATPLGLIPIDREAISTVLGLPAVNIYEHAYDMEHSLEVHLPFLQTVLSNFNLIPCVVGDADPNDIAKLLISLWGGPETLIVISSDLSHYYDYETAKKLDNQTTNSIIKLDPNGIRDNQACGRLPVKGLLLAAAQMQLKAKILDLRNSGDTAGDKKRVVGYGAYYFD